MKSKICAYSMHLLALLFILDIVLVRASEGNNYQESADLLPTETDYDTDLEAGINHTDGDEEGLRRVSIFFYVDKPLPKCSMSPDDPPRDYNPIKTWPNGVVPYEISANFFPDERDTIVKALTVFEEKTCVKFVPRLYQHQDYVSIVNTLLECSSHVGRIGGIQKINLYTPCVTHGTILHEAMHALGFHHEQSRIDRDDYVDINYQNINPNKARQFRKECSGHSKSINGKYDYKSIMHYGEYAASINRKPTIISKINGANIEPSRDLTSNDIQKIRRLYNCPNITEFFVTFPRGTST